MFLFFSEDGQRAQASSLLVGARDACGDLRRAGQSLECRSRRGAQERRCAKEGQEGGRERRGRGRETKGQLHSMLPFIVTIHEGGQATGRERGEGTAALPCGGSSSGGEGGEVEASDHKLRGARGRRGPSSGRSSVLCDTTALHHRPPSRGRSLRVAGRGMKEGAGRLPMTFRRGR